MFRSRVYVFLMLAVAAALALPARGQVIISARSGVVHFFEGAVYVADQPLQSHLGKFTSIPEGAELRTEQGRAEVLLTPGVFLRVGENSAIRMVANSLADTRVELLSGSAIADAAEAGAGTSVTLLYKDWTAHLLQKGVYRMDSQPPRLLVRQGEAEVAEGSAGTPVSVTQGMDLPLAEVLVPEPSGGPAGDSLGDWADGRAESISADNAIAANIEDPGSLSGSLGVDGLGLDGFTYFPLLGYPSYTSSLAGLYGVGGLSRPGFSSIYLPGFTYRPLFLSLPRIGSSGSLYPLPRLGLSPLPHYPVAHYPVTHYPVSHPATPAPAHPVVRAPVHVGVHH